MFIERLKENYPVDTPVFTDEILSLFPEYTRAYVFRLIKKAEADGSLARFDTGVYYMPTQTAFGKSRISPEDVARKRYLADGGNVYGIYGGLALKNMFAVTTQMPVCAEMITNRESMRRREVEIGNMRFILRRSRCPIDGKNERAYTVLQLLSETDGAEIAGNARAKAKLTAYLREGNVTVGQLVALAAVFPARTSKNLFGSGILNEIA